MSPTKKCDQVLRILEEFKAGTQDLAEFWIQYFAVRDEDRTYRGVIEMSQDVSHIRELEGQQRLLDWDCNRLYFFSSSIYSYVLVSLVIMKYN